MTKTMNRGLRRTTVGTVALAMLATMMFVLVHEEPARADHMAVSEGWDFSPAQEPFTAQKDTPKEFFIFLNQSVTTRTLIMMEIESGSSDPDQPTEANGFTPDNSYSKPEAWCYINAGESTCTITYTFTVVPIIGVDNVIARFYINKHLIDTQEQPNESTANQSSLGCDGVFGGPEHENEPDTTEAAQIFVYGAIGGTAPNPVPPPPGVQASRTCENPGGGGTPTQSPTQSPTGQPTQSPTGEPTQSPTGEPTQSPTQSPTGQPTSNPTNTGPRGGPGGTFGEMTMSVSPNVGTYGTDFLISGEVVCHGVKVANARLQIYRHFVGSRSIDVIETSTDVQGKYAFRDTDLRASADYQGMWNGRTGSTSACTSGAETGPDRRRADVRPGVIVNVRDTTLPKGEAATFFGSVIPAHPGQKVFLQVYHGQQGRWEYATETRLDRRSNYSIRFSRNATGYLLFRIAYPTQDLDHSWNISRTVRVDWS
ncbi:MAG TPA: PT domain-containing protein [Actinomycetota bacterium]|nr:PT domain-containing protein [Actinomycetota bacterium]